MRFDKSVEFSAPREQVFAMLADPAFRQRVAETAGADSHDVTVTPNGDGFHAIMETRQSTDQLPGFVKAMLGGDFALRQEESWANHDEGALEVAIPGMAGAPGKLGGVVTLTEHDGVTTQRMTADIEVALPLVGKKIEKLIGQVMGNLVKVQGAIGRDWLTDRE